MFASNPSSTGTPIPARKEFDELGCRFYFDVIPGATRVSPGDGGPREAKVAKEPPEEVYTEG